MSSTATEHTDVLVVGAGPTGLMPAGDLAQAGVWHARTMEELQIRGVADELAAAGTAIRRMTDTDVKIAALVAQGLTNPQIATRLFLSRRTGQTHLEHVFTKLDIGSRVVLAAEIARRSAWSSLSRTRSAPGQRHHAVSLPQQLAHSLRPENGRSVLPMTQTGTRISTLDEHDLAELPPSGHLMTVLVEIPPDDPGTPPHRHSGPVYGYMLEGEMVFELEGDAPRVLRPGETFWEPGGDRIHYQAANPGAVWTRFVAVMAARPGEPMLTLVEPAELEARRARRHPRD